MAQPQKVQDLITAQEAQDLYKEIELTEEETQMALMEARRSKSARINRDGYVKRIFEEPKVRVYTSEGLFDMAKKQFDVDESNEGVIKTLCDYFTEDEKCTLDLKKGLYLYGPIGCGKTELMKWFKHNQTNSFAVFDVNQVSAQFTKEGHEAIYRYKRLIESAWAPFGQRFIGACFDDLGTEVDKKHFGNEANVLAEILFTRYQNKELHRRTHFTTNLNADMLEERYGARLRSRMREMFNIVEFPDSSPDRRK